MGARYISNKTHHHIAHQQRSTGDLVGDLVSSIFLLVYVTWQPCSYPQYMMGNDSLSLSLSLSLVHLSSYLDHTGSQCRVALPGVTTEGKGVFGEQRRISGREREEGRK